jgi:hypothetical protein
MKRYYLTLVGRQNRNQSDDLAVATAFYYFYSLSDGVRILGVASPRYLDPDILSKCDLRTQDVLINLGKDIVARTDIGHSDGNLKRNMVN